MIFAKGEFNVSRLIDDIILIAADQNERHEENEKIQFKHADGWGLVYFEDDQLKIFRSIKPIFEDAQIDQFRKLKTRFIILHARYGTRGNANINNVHPFEYKNGEQHYVFFHNGTVRDNLKYDPKFQPQGETDSERFFFYLLSGLNEPITSDHVHEKLSRLNDFSGANFILTTGKQTIVTSWYCLNPLYYTMKKMENDSTLIISSEILPQYQDKSWKKLNNHEIFSVRTS